jgi:hypothetical protein
LFCAFWGREWFCLEVGWLSWHGIWLLDEYAGIPVAVAIRTCEYAIIWLREWRGISGLCAII